MFTDPYTTLKDQGNSLPRAPPFTAQATHSHPNIFPGALPLAVLSMNSQFTTTLLITPSTLPLDSSPPANLQHIKINQSIFQSTF